MRVLILMAVVILAMMVIVHTKGPRPVVRRPSLSKYQGMSDVRVHEGQGQRSVGARAYATGSELYFAPGPEQQGSHLIAHELTHVVQQRQGR